jgi:hypothetical protein
MAYSSFLPRIKNTCKAGQQWFRPFPHPLLEVTQCAILQANGMLWYRYYHKGFRIIVIQDYYEAFFYAFATPNPIIPDFSVTL